MSLPASGASAALLTSPLPQLPPRRSCVGHVSPLNDNTQELKEGDLVIVSSKAATP